MRRFRKPVGPQGSREFESPPLRFESHYSGRIPPLLRRLLLCARHVVCLGGESPLRAATSGTVRLSKGVGREAESEGSDGGTASMTGARTRRTETGYKAAMQGQSSMRSRGPILVQTAWW